MATVLDMHETPAATAAIGEHFRMRTANEVSTYNTFYASKLVKMSAKQYAFLSMKVAPFTPSVAMGLGNAAGDWALNRTTKEVGGKASFGQYNMKWMHDGFLEFDGRNIFYEHKWMFKNSLDEWKLRSAASQCLFYSALSTTSLDRLESGAFTGKSETVELNKKNKPYMCVLVTTTDSIYSYEREITKKEIKDSIVFYKRKADIIWRCHTSRNWDEISEYDMRWKGKEQDFMFPELAIDDFRLVARDEPYQKIINNE